MMTVHAVSHKKVLAGLRPGTAPSLPELEKDPTAFGIRGGEAGEGLARKSMVAQQEQGALC